MSFLRSPSKRAGKGSGSAPTPAAPPQPKAPASNRASSGYDSGQDSGIAAAASPACARQPVTAHPLLPSPYHKLTRPRPAANQRSSSGHGSDTASSSTTHPVPGVTLRSPPPLKSPSSSTTSRITAFFYGPPHPSHLHLAYLSQRLKLEGASGGSGRAAPRPRPATRVATG